MCDNILYSILFLGHQIAHLNCLNKSCGVFFAYNKGAELENSKFHLILQTHLKE